MQTSRSVGNDRLGLEIRTIVVSTRAAIKSHRDGGRDALVEMSLERGLALLETIESRLLDDTAGDSRKLYEEARRDLEAFGQSRRD